MSYILSFQIFFVIICWVTISQTWAFMSNANKVCVRLLRTKWSTIFIDWKLICRYLSLSMRHSSKNYIKLECTIANVIVIRPYHQSTMCNFFWKLCFCCHFCINSYANSEYCGLIDCNINYVIPKMSTKYCLECVQKECNLKKKFCVSFQLPNKITVDKGMNRLTLFTGPGI